MIRFFLVPRFVSRYNDQAAAGMISQAGARKEQACANAISNKVFNQNDRYRSGRHVAPNRQVHIG